ncbi:MAG: XylR family transcriptional regulator [Chthoniobacteraceae bacterium]|nr:XylR family transcriptional regulator [Chthoniobacteraceae bacterium]
MSKPKQIGLLVDASRAYGRGICRGVAQFAETRADWLILTHERPELEDLPRWLQKARLDGLIAYIPNQRMHRQITALGVPVVDVHGRCRSPRVPVIESDDAAIVRLAFAFFQQSGFRHLAYCGYPGVFFSDQREEAVRLEASSLERVHLYAPSARKRVGADLYQLEKGGGAHEPDLARWLHALPKPAAILTCNDIRGQQVINACREAGIRVPEEVAVLGVDNDELLCRLSRPTLSSIEPDVEQIGALAGRLIADQLDGQPPAPRHRVPPRQVVQRQSTDTVGTENPAVVRAARLIRERDYRGASVEQICEAAGLSRSTLDRLFHAHLGHSVAGEIARTRLQRSQNLLRHTGQSIAEIAQACGFPSATYFCRFFKRETAQTPNTYRKA